MDLVINLKDGSTFKLSQYKIRSVSVSKNLIKIHLKKEDIIFESDQLVSFDVNYPRAPGEITINQMVHINNLTTILTSIIQKQ